MAEDWGKKIEAGGGIVGAFGTVLGGMQSKQSAYMNASFEEFNADQIDYMGRQAVAKQKRQADQIIGNARANYGASGVQSTEGSPLDILQQSASEAALDNIMMKYNYDVAAYGKRRSAKIMRYEGDQALENSYLSAAGQLMTSAAKAVASGGGGGG